MADTKLIYSLELRILDLERKVEELEASLAQSRIVEANIPDGVQIRIDRGESPIRAVREFRMLTQKELGAMSGLRANHISAIERGQGFAVKTARKLAKALGVSPSVLMQ